MLHKMSQELNNNFFFTNTTFKWLINFSSVVWDGMWRKTILIKNTTGIGWYSCCKTTLIKQIKLHQRNSYKIRIGIFHPHPNCLGLVKFSVRFRVSIFVSAMFFLQIAINLHGDCHFHICSLQVSYMFCRIGIK